MSLNEELKQAERSENANTSSDWFKFSEGDNIIQVLTKPEIFYEDYKNGICYAGCGFTGSIKGMSWIIDHNDGKSIKLAKLNYNLLKQLGAWEVDEWTAFSSYPMEKPIKVTAKGAGTKDVEYVYNISPKDIPVQDSSLDELAKNKTCAEIIEKMKEKNMQKHGTKQPSQQRESEIGESTYANYPEEEIDPNDIPF